MTDSTPWGTPAVARRALALALVLLTFAAAAGCSKKTTAPVPQGRITGTVVLPGGGSVANLDVSMSPIGTGLTGIDLAITDAGGAFSFSGLRPGSYVLYAHDFASHCAADTAVVPDVPSNVSAETTSVILTLRAGAVVRGTVTLTGRTDHRGTTVYVDQILALALTDSTGAYTLFDVPTGPWNVTATATSFADQSTPVSIAAPGDTVTAASLLLVPGTPSARSQRR